MNGYGPKEKTGRRYSVQTRPSMPLSAVSRASSSVSATQMSRTMRHSEREGGFCPVSAAPSSTASQWLAT